ncbi:MAG: o-succinylbenzoate--CoA ligase [Candidatus Omnitrophica bacterium]|nr:o-succinylbenzoate--CoA ligase [Candidatus Omnitrophota bacterium]
MNTIPCPVSQHARIFSHNIALISGDSIINYGLLNEKINLAAFHLKGKSVLANMNVALLGEPSIDFIIMLSALWRIKAVACPINTRMPQERILELLKQIDCQVLIDFTEKFSKSDDLAVIHVKNLNDPLPEGESNHINQIDLDRIATIIFTSGSTHEPKAAVHSYGNHHYNAVASNKNIPLAPADRWLLSLPLYHVGGLGILFRSFMAGAAVVIPRNRKNLVEDIKRYDVTCVSLVSTQLNRMLNDHGNVQTLAKMKAILLGGGPIPSRLYREARKNKLPVYATYGLTESSSQVATSDRPLYELETIKARPLKHSQVRITDKGEICLKGKTLFQGYMKKGRPDLPLDEKGWFHTGDIGHLADGYLTVRGRRDNMFISGGENICPEEIEKIIVDIPGIAQAVVIPVEDEDFGARPGAFIKFTQAEITSARMREFLGKLLPSFKIPIAFYIWPESYQQDSMKIQRRVFRKFIANSQAVP